MPDLASIQSIVQHNCDISDARHARDYTMCIYLLKMREFFRWERGYSLTEKLPSADLGSWVEEREARWQQMHGHEFDCLPMSRHCLDPYDIDAINQQLLPMGYAYSAGLGRFVKPHFCLGKLLAERSQDGYQILLTENELARDLSAPPATLRQKTIFIRRDSLRRLLWERVEEWRWRKRPEDAMGRCVACYDFDGDPAQALEQMTDAEVEAAILHELGEGQAGELVGEAWHHLLQDVAHTRVELQARAVRDLIADCASTLPSLIQQQNRASLHFFFANFQAMRRGLWPQLYDAYHRWLEDGQWQALGDLSATGLLHWRQVASWMLQQPRSNGDELEALAAGVEAQKLIGDGR